MPWRCPGLARVPLDDEQVVYDPAHRQSHRLNPTAAVILDRCDGHTSVESVCAEVASAFAVPIGEVRTQVTSALADFAARGLVTTHEPGPDRPAVGAASPSEAARTPPASTPRFVTPARRRLDLVVQIGTDDAGLATEVEGLFGSLVAVEAGGPIDRFYELVAVEKGVEVQLGGEAVGRARSGRPALSLLQWHLNQEVAAGSARRLLLHASAARLDGGGIAVFPAPPNGGKSTLVAGLVRSGLGYLTDETLAVDIDTLECEGYRKAVNLDPGAWPLFDLDEGPASQRPEPPAAERLVDPRTLNPEALTAPATGTATLIAFPAYRAGTATEARPMSRSEALIALIANCVNVDDHGRAGIEALGRLAATVPAVNLPMGDLAEAVALIRSLP